MVELIPFQFEHFELFAWRAEDKETYGVDSELISSLVGAEGKNAECWTAVEDGRIVCIGGVIRVTKRTGHCFTVFSKYATAEKVGTARTVRRMFLAIVREMELHRVVTYNRVGAGQHDKWCKWLGFKLETPEPIRKFDDKGNDYYQYALVMGD